MHCAQFKMQQTARFPVMRRLPRGQVVQVRAAKDAYKVLIVGGGSAGITTAAHYARKLPGQVAVIEVGGAILIGTVVALGCVQCLPRVCSTPFQMENALVYVRPASCHKCHAFLRPGNGSFRSAEQQ
jgi:choline dehydrogenase-like flavoprotein